jgi:hypothetical protein
MDPKVRKLWMSIRRALLMAVAAIEDYCDIPKQPD